MKELKPIEETWNKKRIFLGFIFAVVLITGLISFKNYFLDGNQNPSQNQTTKNSKAVEGASINTNSQNQTNPASDLKTNIQYQINTIQQEASNINLAEIASSSPQVQKVIDDIKSIQNLPKDKVKGFCEQICSGL
jgi:cytoskeletal protein RodZ